MEVISYRRAAELIEDGWTVSTSGFTGSGHPEGISNAIEQRFVESGRPRGLTLLYAAGQGDRATRGTGHRRYLSLRSSSRWMQGFSAKDAWALGADLVAARPDDS